MRKSLLVLAASLLTTACATDRQSAALSDSAARGRAFAQANCARCHAMDDGASPNPAAPSFRRAANRLPDWVVAGSLERGIQIGHTAQMPVFVFREGDVENLIAYLDTLKDKG